MFKFMNNLITKVKEAYALHLVEMDLYSADQEFYSRPEMDELYDSTPIQIFLNGRNVYADSPRNTLVHDGFFYFSRYDYVTISFIKLCIFKALLETDGQGVELNVKGDKWKIIKTRFYLRDLLKTG